MEQSLNVQLRKSMDETNEPQFSRRISVQVGILQELQLKVQDENLQQTIQDKLTLLQKSDEFHEILIKKQESLKLQDKITFVVNFFLILTFAFLIGYSPLYAFIYFYCFLTILVLLIRIIVFVQQNSFLYLFEFCYFANLLGIVFVLFYSQNEFVWYAVWSSDCGVIALAMVVLKNKMALTSSENMISLFIHAAPPAIAWVVRWRQIVYPDQKYNKFNLLDLHDGLTFDDFSNIMQSGLIFYSIWAIFYIIFFHIFCFNLANQTSKYRSCLKDLKQIQKYSEFQQRLIYSVGHFILYIIGMFISVILYWNFILHSIYLVILYMIIFWNGGSYYVDHFSKKYIQKIENLSFTWATQKIQQVMPLDN